MTIYLNLKEELKREPFKEIDLKIPLKDLDLPENYYPEDKDLDIKLHLLKDKDGYVITITLNTTINMSCDRCLTVFPQKFDFTESIVFTKNLDKHQELTEEDLYSEYLEDEEKFNLNEFVREEIIVNTPMKVLCSEDCKGLCPYCGINKNEESCDCEIKMRRKESPFAKLQKLLK